MLEKLIEALDGRAPTDAERAAIYKLLSPEQILVVNGVWISKPARKRRK